MAEPAGSPGRPAGDTASVLAAAMDSHQKGDLATAESLYRAVLEREPAHFTATHLLGVLNNQTGNFQAAAELLSRALRINPRSPLAHLNLGLAFWNLDQPQEALAHYQYSLLFKPDHPEALAKCAMTLQALDRPKEALDRWNQLLALSPKDPSALLNRGFVLQDLHRSNEAMAGFDQALALDPGLVDSLVARASELHHASRNEEALALAEKVLLIDPDSLEAMLVCGIALRAEKRAEDALAVYARATVRHPDSADVFLDCGNTLMGLQRHEEALACYRQVLALAPDHPDGLMNLGSALVSLGRPLEALARFDKCLRIRPGHSVAFMNKGNALLSLGQPEEALACYEQALVLNPASPEALLNKANALLALKRPNEALNHCDHALAVQPDCTDALINKGTALLDLKQPAKALDCYEQALALRPDSPDLLMNRGTALHLLGRHREAIASYDNALSLDPGHARAHSNKIYLLDFIPEVGFYKHQIERREYCDAHAKRLAPTAAAPLRDRNPLRRLVLGYVSADFKHHSAASCFLPILERHSREGFQVNCYSGVLVEDDWTRRFRACSDVWRASAGMSDDALADRIRQDGVDILVDLSGHSKGNRLLVFARKPAPIQVTAWGHGGGTGLPMIDYQFADPVSIPQDVRALFAEIAWDLPCCITFEAPAFAPAIQDLPARSRGHVTFGSLNRFTKVSPGALQLWARILLAVPGSRLLLKDAVFDDPEGRRSVLEALSRLGIEGGRIELRGFTSHVNHLAACNEVDIMLDTFPQNGGITTWEALWMGTPVVAILGNKFVSRVSGAILHALDLGQWVGEDEDQYFRIATRQAADLDGIEQFRRSIRSRILGSPAGNPDLYTQAVEAAYRAMWRKRLGL